MKTSIFATFIVALSTLSNAHCTPFDDLYVNASTVAKQHYDLRGTRCLDVKITNTKHHQFTALEQALVAEINKAALTSKNCGLEIFNERNVKKRTVFMDFDLETYSRGFGDLSIELSDIEVNKTKGLTTFKVAFTQGYSVGNALVKIAYSGLTNKGAYFLSQNQKTKCIALSS